MREQRLRVSAAATLACASVALWATPAFGEDLTIADGQRTWLNGDKLYENVMVAGTVSVVPYDQVDANTGWVVIRAHEITIESTGLIEATGAGFPGAPAGGKGYNNDAGAGQTPPESDPPNPGGGGAHVGSGGVGTTILGCTVFPNAAGGTPYDLASDPLALSAATRFGGFGSAGGSAHSGTNDHTNQGGSGGGIIILEAARITLDGRLDADGQDAPTDTLGWGVLGAASGGGAGGTVVILTNEFSYGASAEVSVQGGEGAVDDAQRNVVGGSGGGGRITLRVGSDNSGFLSQLRVEGGPGQFDCSVHPGGQPGSAEIVDSPSCVDADRDGHASELCGGGDCNDGDDSIHPDRDELCNLIDDNCSGEADEPIEGTFICPQGAGYICEEGECVVDPNAPPPPAAAGPAHVEIGGGLCTSRPGRTVGATAGLSLLSLLLSLAWTRRRTSRAAHRSSPR